MVDESHQSPGTDVSHDEVVDTAEPTRSNTKISLPQMKTIVSKAFKWYRNHSVEHIIQTSAASKPAEEPKPNTAAADKGILHREPKNRCHIRLSIEFM